MDPPALLAFLGLVAIGSYIQTVSGFAIALIIAGGVTALGLAPLPFTANVISFIVLANTITAIYGRYAEIDLKILLYASIGVLGMSGAGLFLLSYLSSHFVDLLKLLLGFTILLSGAMLMVNPQPRALPSTACAHLAAGSLAGLLSGLFGVGGPPVVIHLYRQPLEFPVMRTTLLAILGVMTVIRIGLETCQGHITASIMGLSLYAVPVSILFSLFAHHFPPPASVLLMRRFAFVLLCAMGLFLIISNI